jgi:hypothetical protein
MASPQRHRHRALALPAEEEADRGAFLKPEALAEAGEGEGRGGVVEGLKDVAGADAGAGGRGAGVNAEDEGEVAGLGGSGGRTRAAEEAEEAAGRRDGEGFCGGEMARDGLEAVPGAVDPGAGEGEEGGAAEEPVEARLLNCRGSDDVGALVEDGAEPDRAEPDEEGARRRLVDAADRSRDRAAIEPGLGRERRQSELLESALGDPEQAVVAGVEEDGDPVRASIHGHLGKEEHLGGPDAGERDVEEAAGTAARPVPEGNGRRPAQGEPAGLEVEDGGEGEKAVSAEVDPNVAILG